LNKALEGKKHIAGLVCDVTSEYGVQYASKCGDGLLVLRDC